MKLLFKAKPKRVGDEVRVIGAILVCLLAASVFQAGVFLAFDQIQQTGFFNCIDMTNWMGMSSTENLAKMSIGIEKGLIYLFIALLLFLVLWGLKRIKPHRASKYKK